MQVCFLVLYNNIHNFSAYFGVKSQRKNSACDSQ